MLERISAPLFFVSASTSIMALSIWIGSCFQIMRDCGYGAFSSLGAAAICSTPLWIAAFTVHHRVMAATIARLFCLLAIGAFFVSEWERVLLGVVLFPLRDPSDGLGSFIGNIVLYRAPFVLAFTSLLMLLVLVGRDFRAWLTGRPTERRRRRRLTQR